MKCVCGAAFCWLCGKEIDDAVFPRHFQWWNANGCANMQMNNEIEPHWSTRVFARGLAIAQIVILGPLSALSTFLSILLCPCCLSAVAAPQETLFLRFFEVCSVRYTLCSLYKLNKKNTSPVQFALPPDLFALHECVAIETSVRI